MGVKANAQQLPIFSQYMNTGFLINPAIAGVDGYNTITAVAREQWLGLTDAPKTHLVAFQGRLLKSNHYSRKKSVWRKFTQLSRNGNVGLGGYLFNDKNGLIDRTGAQFTYAYHIRMNDGQLSFGVSASIYQYSLDRNKLVLENQNDGFVNKSDFKMYMPDFNFGAYYLGTNYYAGFSIAQLSQSSIQFSNDNYSQFRLYRHYYLTGGYSYEIDRKTSIVPSVLIKATNQLATQVDLSVKAYFNDSYYAGLSFRTGSAFIVLGGVTVDKYTFGYAFDYNLNAIRKHSFGSHEFVVNVKFGDTPRRYRWINRY